MNHFCPTVFTRSSILFLAAATETKTFFGFDPILGGFVSFLIFIAFCIIFAISYSKTTKPVTPKGRFLLTFLRIIALLMVFITVLRPKIESLTIIPEPASLLIIEDKSRSMSIKDCPGKVERYKEVQKFWKDNKGNYKEIGGYAPDNPSEKPMFHVSRNYFGRGLDLEYGKKIPKEDFTYLGDALDEGYNKLKSKKKKVAAAFVITDGSNNGGRDPISVAQDFQRENIPIYFYMPGQNFFDGAIKDIQIHDITCKPTVYKNNTTRILSRITVFGYAGKTVKIELTENDQSLNPKQIIELKVPSNENQYSSEIEFEYTGLEEGEQELTIRATAFEDEIRKDNNFKTTLIRVISGAIQILYVEGAIRWESKFINRTFHEANNMDVTSIISLTRGKKEKQIPKDKKEWMKYDVIILGDIDRLAFTDEQLKIIEEMVTQKGKGLIMIGGYNNFGAGGYENTPIEELLPVEISRNDKFDESKTFEFKLTNDGQRHFSLMMGKDEKESQKVWEKLDKLTGYMKCGKAKGTSIVLAEGPNNNVLMATSKAGNGRVMAMLCGTTWQWYLSPKDTSKYHKRFWRQLVIWLSGRDNIEKAEFNIGTDSYKYNVNERVKIIGSLSDAAGNAIESAKVVVEIERNTDKELVKLKNPENKGKVILTFDEATQKYHGTFQVKSGGRYKFSAIAKIGNKELGNDSSNLIVRVPDLEMDNPVANLDLLQQIAYITKGKVYQSADDKSKIFEDIKKQQDEVKLEIKNIKYLWDNLIIFIIFIIALSLEWYLRKKYGLV